MTPEDGRTMLSSQHPHALQGQLSVSVNCAAADTPSNMCCRVSWPNMLDTSLRRQLQQPMSSVLLKSGDMHTAHL